MQSLSLLLTDSPLDCALRKQAKSVARARRIDANAQRLLPQVREVVRSQLQSLNTPLRVEFPNGCAAYLSPTTERLFLGGTTWDKDAAGSPDSIEFQVLCDALGIDPAGTFE